MQIAQNTLTPGSESATRPSNSNVLNYQRTPDMPERESGERKVVAGSGQDGLVKSPYLILISRLETMLLHQATDEEPLAQLRVMLSNRVQAISKDARTVIQDLPEFAATGAASADQLPVVMDRMLRNPETAQPGLQLLKHPLFVSHMNRGDRAMFYGPRGLLRAS